jgi:hypothetical protein
MMARSRNIQEGIKNEEISDPNVKIEELRPQIDSIGREIVAIVVARMKLIRSQISIPGYGIEKIN